MGKTKDLGHLAHIVAYNAENHITVPAGITMHTNQLVASQSYVTTALSSYALSSSLSSYVPTSRTITINGTTLDLSANRTFTIAAGLSSFNTRTGDVTLTSSDVTTALGFTPVTNARTITINGTAYDLSANREWNITSMIYPAAGIALSTGSAWGTSITNNSANWNTAFGWGNHASAGYLTGITSTQVTTALGFTPYNSTNPNGYISSYTETDTLATVMSRGASTASGITFTASGGTVLLKHAVSEVDAWIFQENAVNWGLYWKNNPSGHHTFGGYTTVGAELFGMSAANASGNGINTSNFVGATSAIAQWMISNYTGYIWSASTIFAAGAMRAYEFRGNGNVGGTGEASWHPAGAYIGGTMWQYGDMYKNNTPIYNLSYLGITGGSNTPIEITGAAHKYLTINPGNGYEAMVRYIGGSGSGWYVGKRTSGQLVGTQSFHFYSEEAGATVGGIDPGGVMFAVGAMRAPIFYDHNDTGFYLDPNSESNLNRFTSATMTRNAMNYLSINSPIGTRAAQGRPYQNGTMGWGTVDFNTIFSNWGSGFIDTWSSPGNAPGGSSHYVGFQSLHYNFENNTNAYGFQMACAGEASNRYFWRNAWPGLQSWVEMIHSGNIGSQTVSTAGNLSVNATANNIYNSGWFRNYGDSGLYNQDYGCHIARNSQSSHGSWSMWGYTKAGYVGMNLQDPQGYNNNLMFEQGRGGVYQENGGGWHFYYDRPNDCLGLSGSETYDWVRACTNGKHRITNDTWCDATSWAYTFSNISDGRLKENIVTVDSALDKVLQLRGVYYNWIIDTENKKHIGLIAQETAAVCPEVVNYHDETDTYSVNYSELSGLFVESTKELNQKLMDANARIELLETKLNQLLNA